MMHSEIARPWPTICVCFLYEIWLDNEWTIDWMNEWMKEWMNEWTNKYKKDIKHKQACASKMFPWRYLVDFCFIYTIAKMRSTLFYKKIFFHQKEMITYWNMNVVFCQFQFHSDNCLKIIKLHMRYCEQVHKWYSR